MSASVVNGGIKSAKGKIGTYSRPESRVGPDCGRPQFTSKEFEPDTVDNRELYEVLKEVQSESCFLPLKCGWMIVCAIP